MDLQEAVTTAPAKRQLHYSEKALLAVSLLAVVLLAAFGLRDAAKPHYALDLATPETACKSLVKALLHEDEAGVKRLTTPHGYAMLQERLKSGPFNSYPKLANRIMAEWGHPVFWEEDPLMLKSREASGFYGRSRTVKPGEPTPGISLKRTPQAWKLDDYMPGPDRLMKRAARHGATWNIN